MAALAGTAFPQGREFRKNPPFQAPTSQHIIDMHVHDFFQEDKPNEPEFAPQLNNSRPDGIYQMNAGWKQFQYDMGPVYKAVLLHVA